jgi:hypothetical protein
MQKLNRREILAGTAAACLAPVLPGSPTKTEIVETRLELIESLLNRPFEMIAEFDYFPDEPSIEIALISGARIIHQGSAARHTLAQTGESHTIIIEGDVRGVKALGEMLVMEWLAADWTLPEAVQAVGEIWSIFLTASPTRI